MIPLGDTLGLWQPADAGRMARYSPVLTVVICGLSYAFYSAFLGLFIRRPAASG